MTSDWQSSHVLNALKARLQERDQVTTLVQNVSGIPEIERAWVKKRFLCVVLSQGLWSVPVKSKLFAMLPELSSRLDVILEDVKIKKDLQNETVKA